MGPTAFTSPTKEGVLRVVFALINPSSLTGFEPTSIGSNGKHANHQTTRGECVFELIHVYEQTAEAILINMPYGCERA
jgi:hypothetical protein